MLKIAEYNTITGEKIDLKELKHCYISDDDFDQIWSYKNVLFDKDTRIIFQDQFFNDLGGKRLDDLYDLIKDELVVKVNERQNVL